MNRLLITLLLVLTSPSALSLLPQINQITIQKLAETPTWKQLLGYTQDGSSEIKEPTFFLSPEGHHDPLEELKATLSAFATKPPQGTTNPQCQFPARYLWLKRHIDTTALGVVEADCIAYRQFSLNGKAESISLLFATGYLGNPASYYGHLLIKINAPTTSFHTTLQDTSINIGARVPPNEAMPSYIVKGLVGGYRAAYSTQAFAFNARQYGEDENRDIWEYSLDLTPDVQELLIAHIWELQNSEYDYYFANRNCAYRIAALLQIITDKPLASTSRPWYSPQTLIQRLNEATLHGEKIVDGVIYHPSRQSRFYFRHSQLSTIQKRDMANAVYENLNTEHSNWQDQPAIVDTLIDYYQTVHDSDSSHSKSNRRHYQRAVAARFALPEETETDLEITSRQAPHDGRRVSYVNVGIAHPAEGSDTVQLTLRPVYYDALDAEQGHVTHSTLSMAEVSVRSNRHRSYIQRINLVSIENIHTGASGLPGDKNRAWLLEVGAAQQEINCDSCLGGNLRAGYGISSGFNQNRVALHAMGIAGFLGDSFSEENAYTAVRAGISTKPSNHFSALLHIEQRLSPSGDHEFLMRSDMRWRLTKNIDARVHATKNEKAEFGLSLGWYW